MNETIQTHLNNIRSKDKDLQNAAYSYLMEATGEPVDWEAYYSKIDGRPPRPLLRGTLTLYRAAALDNPRQAIDLGCGDGTDTVFLLENGWRVLAIDGEAKAFDRLQTKVPDELKGDLQTQIARFEDVSLPSVDLIHASLTLPFCHPAHFAALWQKIGQSLGANGRFAGHFFGVNDDWANTPHMTFHTKAQVLDMLARFEIEHFEEEDKAGKSTKGAKHWHIFTIIARKK